MLSFQQIIDKLILFLYSDGITILEIVAFSLLGLLIVRIINKTLKSILLRSPMENSLVSFIHSILSFVLYLTLIITVASKTKIPMTSFIAIISAIGLAVSLAIQGSLSNLANGIVIITTKPFKEGDYIEINGNAGTVKAINMFNTKLTTFDNKVVIIPNSQIVNNNLVNFSGKSTRRVDLNFGVSYDSDIHHVKKVLNEVVKKHAKILKNPEPIIRLSEHRDSSLNFVVKVWTSSHNYWDVFYDLNEQVFDVFKKNLIKIPYPQVDVHIDNDYIKEEI